MIQRNQPRPARDMREAFPPLHADATKATLAGLFFPLGLAVVGFIFAAAVVGVIS